jgi:hypothetical protein
MVFNALFNNISNKDYNNRPTTTVIRVSLHSGFRVVVSIAISA